MKYKVKKAGRLFNRILKATLGAYLIKKFNLRFFDENGVDSLEPPYIVLANHTNAWDPFIISNFFKYPVYFVTSDEYFRSAILRWLLSLVGSIPKTKFVSDANTVASMLTVTRKYNDIVGIYPEGRRNWDGKTLKLLYPTAKLVKSFKLPVVTVISKGAYLSFPRWASGSRTGRIDSYYRVIIDKEEAVSLTTDEIYDRIGTALDYDEYDFQRKEMIPFKAKRLAERIELFLFTCPVCKKIDVLRSCNDTVKCTSCGFQAKYDEFGFIKGCDRFDNPHDWDVWQVEHLKTLLGSKSDTSYFEDHNIFLQIGGRMIPMKDFRLGRLSLYSDRITFDTLIGDHLVYEMDKIQGANIQRNNQFEFYYDKVLYKFLFKFSRATAYKWGRAMELLKKTDVG